MIIGIPKEIKTHEYRVGMTPSGVAELKNDAHTILVEAGAGEGSGFTDNEYLDADADIVDKETIFERSELIVKVKEPLPSEYHLMKEGLAIFTYLHLAPNPELTQLLHTKKNNRPRIRNPAKEWYAAVTGPHERHSRKNGSSCRILLSSEAAWGKRGSSYRDCR
jgi:hypothetical protein